MYGGFLYRLNYEAYKKREAEIDKKLMKLSEESEDEDIMPLDEAYIIRFDTEDNEDFAVQDSGYFVLLVGDYNFDCDYAQEVICGLDESYGRYVELKNSDKINSDLSASLELVNLQEDFSPYEQEDVSEIADDILAGEADYGEVIKQIF